MTNSPVDAQTPSHFEKDRRTQEREDSFDRRKFLRPTTGVKTKGLITSLLFAIALVSMYALKTYLFSSSQSPISTMDPGRTPASVESNPNSINDVKSSLVLPGENLDTAEKMTEKH